MWRSIWTSLVKLSLKHHQRHLCKFSGNHQRQALEILHQYLKQRNNVLQPSLLANQSISPQFLMKRTTLTNLLTSLEPSARKITRNKSLSMLIQLSRKEIIQVHLLTSQKPIKRKTTLMQEKLSMLQLHTMRKTIHKKDLTSQDSMLKRTIQDNQIQQILTLRKFSQSVTNSSKDPKLISLFRMAYSSREP